MYKNIKPINILIYTFYKCITFKTRVTTRPYKYPQKTVFSFSVQIQTLIVTFRHLPCVTTSPSFIPIKTLRVK